jgi:single-strand DNA-binding protein
MSLELSGKIYQIGETVNVSDTFSKREFIIETDEQYKSYIQLQFTKDKTSLLDKFKVGESVIVSYNLQGRLWTNKDAKEVCFNTLQAWLIKHDATTPTPATVPVAEFAPAPKQPAGQVEDDGLPF